MFDIHTRQYAKRIVKHCKYNRKEAFLRTDLAGHDHLDAVVLADGARSLQPHLSDRHRHQAAHAGAVVVLVPAVGFQCGEV